MPITVLRPIEEENPFVEIANWINEELLPLLFLYRISKPKIERLSDTELRDYVGILKTEFPQLITPDGKIDWNTVETLYQFGTPEEQKVATFLKNAKALREEYANATLYEKLSLLDQVGTATSPDNLKKIITVGKGIKAVKEIIEKTNAPDEVKLWFVLNSEAFYEKPEVLKLILDILTPKKEKETKQETTSETGWRLSLEPDKQLVKLDVPLLVFERPSPPQIPTQASEKKLEKKKEQSKQQKTPPKPQEITPFIPNYRPKEPALQTPFLDPIDLLLGGVGLGALIGAGVLGRKKFVKLFGNIKNFFKAKKAPKQIVEKPTEQTVKEVVEEATDKTAGREVRRLELKQRIEEELKKQKTPDFEILETTYAQPKEETFRRLEEWLRATRRQFERPITTPIPQYGEVIQKIPPEVLADAYRELIRRFIEAYKKGRQDEFIKTFRALPPPPIAKRESGIMKLLNPTEPKPKKKSRRKKQ